MPGFRYSQFCPLARAAEILGERWTLLVIRELFCGPQRFSDLQRRLPGVSSSVLTERLVRLEEKGITQRRELPPPAASTVYELAEAGRALERPLLELMRWGLRWLEAVPGDHIEPDWVALGLRLFARRTRSPELRVEICLVRDDLDADPELRVRVAGGPDGTRVDGEGEPFDARVTASSLPMLGLASGALAARDLVAAGAIRVDGDVDTLNEFSGLFDFAGVAEEQPGESMSFQPPETDR